MKTLIVINEKGGVGKTTLATSTASECARNGLRVLLIDADPQEANATAALGMERQPHFHDLLVRNASWRDMLLPVPKRAWQTKTEQESGSITGTFAIMVGNEETRNIANMTSDNLILRKRLNEIKSLFDLVVIDTSPTPSMLNAMLLYASTNAAFPAQMEALPGIALPIIVNRCQDLYKQARANNIDMAKPTAIVPMMVRIRTNLHSVILERSRKTYGGLVVSPVQQAIAISEAQTRRIVPQIHGPDLEVTKRLRLAINTILKRLDLKHTPLEEFYVNES